MIVLVHENNEKAFLAFEKNDVFSSRVVSDYKIFGMDNTAFLFYIQRIEGRVTAILSRINGVVTVSVHGDGDLSEIFEFIEGIGYLTVLCDKRVASFANQENGDILLYSGGHRDADLCVEIGNAENLHEVYPLLCGCFDKIPPFEFWYTDLSHRIRHGGAGFVTVRKGQELVSCAFSLFHTGDSMVISGVCTKKGYRSSGYASACVQKLVGLHENQHMYIFTENKNVTRCYKNLGFTVCGQWCERKKEE